MTHRFTEEDVIARVSRLSRIQLTRFVERDFVRPRQEDTGYVFHRVDIARLELLCDLSQDLDLDDAALDVIISLIDQLHTARQELATLVQALDALPSDLRSNVVSALKKELKSGR